ncbi:MAG TPA: MBL fold metallo-hydrolase [Chryseolinea sp.]|nr:MBL fold metallo-hydrolase [Chryseolinea sp.]
MTVKRQPLVGLLLLGVFITPPIAIFGQNKKLEEQTWIHGSADCRQNKDAGLQVVKYDPSTYILRQNKCLNYEAPFLYLFIGANRALLLDTGAEAPDDAFPLFETIKKILSDKGGKMLPLVVVHSHGHSDHYSGDHQFKGKQGVQLIPPTKDAVIEFFQLKNWPDAQASFDLGNRVLNIIPIPGHDQMSIALYDPQTRWLLTGDTIYPGRLYVRDGQAFCSSIERLLAFSKEHPVQYLMGNHIEMSQTKGVDYPTGMTFQPDEHILPLDLKVLDQLRDACEKMQNRIVYYIQDDFIIVPK